MFWVLAFLITLSASYYQRVTGPTYPRKGTLINNKTILKYKLTRSSNTGKDLIIRIPIANNTKGYLFYKKYNTTDNFTVVEMINQNDTLIAAMPSQPPAGKLLYTIILKPEKQENWISEKPVIVRFKCSVPYWILILHIFFIFLAMFFSNFTGLLALYKRNKQMYFALITLGLTIIGGLLLGPLVQKFAFGELWTGVPLGWDLTDNKILIGFTGWLVAVCANYKKKRRGWFIAAAILTLIVYSIPHSLFGSQLDYSSGIIKQE